MPRIGDRLLNSVVYMYFDHEHATSGSDAGGSGFLVGQETDDERTVLYIVTCHHVVDAGASVARLRRFDWESKFADRLQWHFGPEDDLAIAAVAVIPEVVGETNPYGYDWIPRSFFAIEEDLENPPVDEEAASDDIVSPWAGPWIGAGDDVVHVGRYLASDGVETNEPSVRFGNLSTPRPVDLERTTEVYQSSFLVEMRSLPGYSGSPVVQFNDTHTVGGWSAPIAHPNMDEGMRLLGIDYGEMKVPDGARPHQFEVRPCVPGDASDGRLRSGMMVVVPAWRIATLIDTHLKGDLKMLEKRETVEEHLFSESEFDASADLTRELVRDS